MKLNKDQAKGLLHLGRVIRLVWDAAPRATAINTLLIFIRGVLPLLSLYLTKLVVDSITYTLSLANPRENFPHVLGLVALAGGVQLTGMLCSAIASVVTETQSQSVADSIFDVLHRKSVEVDLEYYETPQYFDNLHLAQREAPYRPLMIVNGLTQLGQGCLSLAAVAALLFAFHWAIAVIILIAAVPGVIVRFRFARRNYRWHSSQAEKERRASYLHWLLTGETHAKEIRLFSLGKLFADRFRALRTELRVDRLKLVRQRAMADLGAQVLAIGAVFACLGMIAMQALDGNITLGDMVMYYQAFLRGQGYVSEIFRSLSLLYENGLFLTNFFSLMAMKPKVKEPEHPRPIPTSLQRGVVFDDVNFRYPGMEDDVLKNISFTIRPGEHIALVGKNGAGKTTLIKLLCRLYDATSGSVRMDDVDLRDIATDELRSNIAVLFQDYARYSLSVRENIWLGNAELPADTPRVEEAARLAGAHELISALPEAYDTNLGRSFASGHELSIGQWQSIALARAFMRDSQILVLDEPTSALDPEKEHQLFEQFHKLATGRTAIIISHRMTTVRMADRIVVFDEGTVKECGTHDELLAARGLYAHLYELQAGQFN